MRADGIVWGNLRRFSNLALFWYEPTRRPPMRLRLAGISTGVAEICGGDFIPSIAGFVARHFGIQHTLTVGLFGLSGGLILSFAKQGVTASLPFLKAKNVSYRIAEGSYSQAETLILT